MKLTHLSVAGACLVEPVPSLDERGHFTKLFDSGAFAALGLVSRWEQEATSYNRKAGTLRGLHYQACPLEEAKLVRCTQGAIFDVFIDLRAASPTYLRWQAVELRPDGMTSLYIPAGFAHGYQTLVHDTAVHYLISVPYKADMQCGIRWDDPTLAIPWPLVSEVLVSPRDAALPLLGGRAGCEPCDTSRERQ